MGGGEVLGGLDFLQADNCRIGCCLVWCGMVRYGMVWFGVVWAGQGKVVSMFCVDRV